MKQRRKRLSRRIKAEIKLTESTLDRLCYECYAETGCPIASENEIYCHKHQADPDKLVKTRNKGNPDSLLDTKHPYRPVWVFRPGMPYDGLIGFLVSGPNGHRTFHKNKRPT